MLRKSRTKLFFYWKKKKNKRKKEEASLLLTVLLAVFAAYVFQFILESIPVQLSSLPNSNQALSKTVSESTAPC